MKLSVILLIVAASYCCAKHVDIDPRIVGGEFAAENQFPHQIAIIYNGRLRCGGSIIAPLWVLTAAHCVVGGIGTVDGLSILAGSTKISAGGERRNVIESIYHEHYGNFMNDIALMRLEIPLEFSGSIKPINLETKELSNGDGVTIVGWGKTSNWGGVSDRLKFNKLRAVTQGECAKSSGIDFEGLLCLGHETNNGACNGDSGGSAIRNGKLVGVANFVVFGCGSSNPDGYAKVSFFTQWIADTMTAYEVTHRLRN